MSGIRTEESHDWNRPRPIVSRSIQPDHIPGCSTKPGEAEVPPASRISFNGGIRRDRFVSRRWYSEELVKIDLEYRYSPGVKSSVEFNPGTRLPAQPVIERYLAHAPKWRCVGVIGPDRRGQSGSLALGGKLIRRLSRGFPG